MSNKNGAGRAQWASNMGFVLAAAGSAVGLGNIWKFPGKAHAGGGGAFIIIYLLIVAVIGSTVMLTEFVVGRKTQKNVVGAFRELNKKWTWIGGLGVFTGFVILSYYAQVGGWVIKYVIAYVLEPATVYADPLNYFYGVLGANSFPLEAAIIFPLIFLGTTVFIVLKGVSGGIEKFNKFAMPTLFALLIILMVRAVTLPGASEGVAYLLHVDFSTITADTFLVALGQAFFSLSLGMGVMCTYGSYLNKKENLVSNTATICVLDTVIALIAGFMIIPAVFATGVEPGMGGGFAFASLAGVFQNMPAGAIFGVMFYVLLLFAALTSAISILEGIVAFICEEKGYDRTKATLAIAAVIFVVGVFYTLSQANMPLKGAWYDLVNGFRTIPLGDFMEYLTDRLLMPLGALMFCIFVGWIWGPENGIAEVEQDGMFKFGLAKVWCFVVKYVAPLAIIAILVGGLVFGMALS